MSKKSFIALWFLGVGLMCINSFAFLGCQNNKESEVLLQRQLDTIILNIPDSVQFYPFVSDSLITYAIDFYRRSGNRNMLAYSLYCKGRVLHALRDRKSALIYYMKSLEEARAVSDSSLLTEVYYRMGLLHYFQRLPEQALDDFNNSLYYWQQTTERKVLQTEIWRGKALAYKYLNAVHPEREISYEDSAAICYRRALEQAVSEQAPDGMIASIQAALCNLYARKGQHAEAVKCLEQSNTHISRTYYYSLKADLCEREGKLDSACHYLRKGIETADGDNLCYIYYKLFSWEKRRGNLSKSLSYAEQYIRSNDSLIRLVQPLRIEEIRQKYNNERLRSERAELQLEQQRVENRFLWIAMLFALVVILAACLGIYVLIKQRCLQQRLAAQRNELLTIEQHLRFWREQVQLQGKRIASLEEEKRLIISAHYEELDEKEALLQQTEQSLVALRATEQEMIERRKMYETLCQEQFRYAFLRSKISSRIPAFGREPRVVQKLTTVQQQQLTETMNETCACFAERLSQVTQLSEVSICICCLLKLQVASKHIMTLCGLSADAYFKQCQRLGERLTGHRTMADLKQYIENL